jgi:hypothetical protein
MVRAEQIEPSIPLKTSRISGTVVLIAQAAANIVEGIRSDEA